MREAQRLQMLELLHAMAEAVLEDREQRAFGGAQRGGDRIAVGERADQRLFADHIHAGGQRLLDQCPMREGWRAEVDDVQIATGQ